MLLVMGYNGKEALKIKEAFIDQYEAMEQALKSKALTVLKPPTAKEMASIWAKQAELEEQLEEEKQGRLLAEKSLDECMPAIDYTLRAMESSTKMSIEQVSKHFNTLGMGRNKTWEALRSLGIVRYVDKINTPYQKYMKFFYQKETLYKTDFGVKTQISYQVTQEGLLFVQDLFRRNNII